MANTKPAFSPEVGLCQVFFLINLQWNFLSQVRTLESLFNADVQPNLKIEPKWIWIASLLLIDLYLSLFFLSLKHGSPDNVSDTYTEQILKSIQQSIRLLDSSCMSTNLKPSMGANRRDLDWRFGNYVCASIW